MEQQTDPRILGTEPIGKLLLQYSIPAIIGMTITSLYNIIDSIFIGHGVGPMAISGLAITFPLMNLVVAFCVLISAGGATISSIRLGQKDIKGATDVLGNTLDALPDECSAVRWIGLSIPGPDIVFLRRQYRYTSLCP